MIIGNSLDATYYKVYRRLDDSNEIVNAHWSNDAFNLEYDDDEMFEYLGDKIEPYIDDEWDKSKYYKTDSINLLIECDFCGKHIVMTEQKRMRSESRYRKTLNSAGKQTEYGESYLYKDHCKSCKYDKIQETMMITHGFSNPFQTPQARENWMKSFKEVNLVKTSRGQRYLADMFDGELNVPVNYYFADMIIDNKIVIEYDGGGHNYRVKLGVITQEEFDIGERIREKELIAKGYKILRFVSESDYFPEESITKRIVSEAIANLYLTDQNIATLTMSKKVNDPNYGKLKPIKEVLKDSQYGGGQDED